MSVGDFNIKNTVWFYKIDRHLPPELWEAQVDFFIDTKP